MKKSRWPKVSVLLVENACTYEKDMKIIFGKKYSRIDQPKFFEDSPEIDVSWSVYFKLKVIFCKFYFVRS